MATVQNMLALPPGDGGDSRLLPALRQSASIVSTIKSDILAIERSVQSIVQGMRNMGGGAGFSYSWGKPQPNGGFNGGGGGNYLPPVSFGGMQALPPGGGGGNYLPAPVFNGQPGSPGGAGTGGGGAAGGNRPGWGALGIGSLAGSWLNQTMGKSSEWVQSDLVWNQIRNIAGQGSAFQQQLAGGGVGSAARMYAGGYLGNADLIGAMQAGMAGGLGPSLGNAAFAKNLSNYAQLTGTDLTGAMAAQNAVGVGMDPFTRIRLRSMGINTLDSKGQALSPQAVLAQIERMQPQAFSSLDKINATFGPAGQLRNMLGSMGFDASAIGQMQQLSVQAFQQNTTVDNLNPKTAGSHDTILTTARNRASQQQRVLGDQFQGIVEGMKAANNSAAAIDRAMADALDKARGIATALGQARGFAAGVSHSPDGSHSVLGSWVTDVGHMGMQALFDKAVFGKGGGGLLGGVFRRGAGRGAATVAESGASRGLLGRLGIGVGERAGLGAIAGEAGLGPIGWAAAAATAASFGGNFLKHNAKHHHRGFWTGLEGGLGEFFSNPLKDAIDPIDAVRSSWNAFSGGGGFGASDSPTSGSGVPSGNINASNLLSFAAQEIGVPYSWGGGGESGPGRGFAQGANTVGFDCSSFVQYVFGHFGVHLPRTTYEQVKMGVPVPPDKAGPGDLLFFGPEPHHVAIYMGNGQMIEAPHTGASIRISSVDPKSCSYIRRVMNVNGTLQTTGGSGVAAGGSLINSPFLSGAGAAAANIFATSAASLNSIFGGNTSVGGGGGGKPGSGAGAPKGVKGSYSIKQLAQLAKSVGFSGMGLVDAVAVALAESGGDPNSTNYNSDSHHSVDKGLWQINSYWHNEVQNPYDPLANAQAAYRISGGGANWGQWSSWAVNHTAQGFIPQVRNALGYSTGAWNISTDQNTRIHAGEMILPKHIAEAVRSGMSGLKLGGGSGGCTVTIQVFPTKVDQNEAKKLATMVKDLLDHDSHLDMLGAH